MSIFSKFFFTLFGLSIPAWLREFISRVTGDGGTLSDRGHTKEVYNDTNDYNPTLIQSCDSGKATVAYSVFAFDDVDDFELRVVADSGTNVSTRQDALFAQHLWRNELHNNASLVVPCASYKAGRLYAYQPTVEPDTTLLDYYTGSAAAYSLRSLSAGTINVVKVRRSGDDAELDFTATEVSDGTLAAWVTAGGGTEDGFVTTWYDQSGNGNNATQATAANQPKIVSAGSLVTENGKAALEFDGSNDRLEINETFNTSFSGFVTATAGGGRQVDIMRGGQSGAFLAGSVDATSGFRFRTDSTDIDYLALDTNQHLHTWINDTTNSFAAADGASFISGADAAISQTSLYISSSLAVNWIWDGTIQEIILYASDQSANRTGIEGNINDYYNIFS